MCFSQRLPESFEFLKAEASDDIVADIAISDEDFQRIELHSAVIEVAKIIVQWAVLPIAKYDCYIFV